MDLSKSQGETIVRTAKLHVGFPHSSDFRCKDLARDVYRQAGIDIGEIDEGTVPADLNIKKGELSSPPPGCLIFLKDTQDGRNDRAWTHIAIMLKDGECIHCSIFSEGKVAVSTLKELLGRYQYAESKTAQ